MSPFLFRLQSDAGWEEYYDYIFPDDEANQPNFKLLQMARMWKHAKDDSSDEESDKSNESDDGTEPRKAGPRVEENPDQDTDMSSESDSDSD